MAQFEAMKKSLEAMEKNVKLSTDLLETRVNALDEMKRNLQEADTEAEKRELKIAIDGLELIINADRASLSDLDTACKGLREEFDKEVAAKEAREAEATVEDDIIEEEDDQTSEPEERRRTYTRAELEAEVNKRGVAGLSSKFEKLCQALSEGEEEKRKREGEDRFFRSSVLPTPEKKRILGTLPSFVTGTTDFQLHLEAFRDYCELNDLTDNPLKVKRLFLTSLDQTARLRCAGLEPDKPPCSGMGYVDYLNRLREMFIPKANLLITQQAFHERRQKAGEIPADYVMSKWSLFKRGWTNPPAPFSFFYEACTAGLLDEALRNEIYREQTRCDDSNDRILLNAAFQSYLERVQQCVAYIRRTCGTSNPSSRGLGVVGQGTNLGAKPIASQSISEVDEESWSWGEESWDEPEEVGELNEEEVALVENWEDDKLTKIINEESASVEEAGGPGVKLCFVCRGPHLARVCPQRLRNVSGAMRRMGVAPRGSSSWRGSRRGRGGPARGGSRGRSGSLSGYPLQLPPPQTSRPISSSQPGHRRQDF